MRLSPEAAEKVAAEYPSIRSRLEWLNARLLAELSPTLKSEKALEYLQHGVGRRLRTIERCMTNVFEIFPPGRTELLKQRELHDVQINLQGFLMNVYGLFDNIAWVYILEQGRADTIRGGRRAIGLFDERTQEHLSAKMRAYLGAADLQNWYSDYSKNFRDALAHRIPPYVAPFAVTAEQQKRWKELDAQIMPAIRAHRFEDAERLREERDSVGTIVAAFRHSFSDSDGSRAVMIHPQMLSDALTVMDLMEAVIADVKQSGWGVAPL